MHKSFPFAFIMIMLCVKGAAQGDRYYPVSISIGLSGKDSAVQLFDQAMALLHKNNYPRQVGWDSLADIGRKQLQDAATCSDAYAAINDCLQRAEQKHSFVMPQKNTALYHNDSVQLKRKPLLKEVMGRIGSSIADDGIGYLAVPWVNTTDTALGTIIADSLQGQIRQLAAKGVTKWIIDLRKNTGGNCWPMLAGMGPLLGDGVCGYFVRKSNRTTIRYEAGAARHGSTVMCTVKDPFTLTDQQRTEIVVLTGQHTSSAGEIVALAFRGLPHVRLIGEATAGLTTANTTYDLMDGSMLVLTVCKEADRHGNVCEGKIIPDDVVMEEKMGDAVLGTAMRWLQSQ